MVDTPLIYLKKLGNFLKSSSDETKLLENFIYEISKVLNSDITFIDTKGKIITEINEQMGSIGLKDDLTDEIMLEAQAIGQITGINENKMNITLDNLYISTIDKSIVSNFYSLFLPIFISNKKFGVIIIYRENEKFDDSIEIVCEYISSIISILIATSNNSKNIEEERQKSIIKSSIGTLSYSELEAILNIFQELDKDEGIIIARNIADKAGITRSVIVNALRKFESSEIIESRSLGMKGTYIKVLNKYLFSELLKYKK